MTHLFWRALTLTALIFFVMSAVAKDGVYDDLERSAMSNGYTDLAVSMVQP